MTKSVVLRGIDKSRLYEAYILHPAGVWRSL